MSVTDIAVDVSESKGLAERIAALLTRNYSGLRARIRTLDNEIKCPGSAITLRLYYPAFRSDAPTIGDLVDTIALYIISFALPRSQIAEVYKLYDTVTVEEFSLRHSELEQRALALFKRVQDATQRNGEAGELLLYILTEWILEAPQLLAKMCLKTNRNMPVHGSDGVHVRYFEDKKVLCLYYGESKLHAEVGKAISAAMESTTTALKHESTKHEIELVHRHIDLTGFDQDAKQSILQYLDPLDEQSNHRVNVVTCLIGFNFDAFKSCLLTGEEPEIQFRRLALAKLTELAPQISDSLKTITNQVEFFFFPVPSVEELRDLFQSKIGWKKPSDKS
jgi:hypothetical protein